ncbi:MAG: sarcosine oxidase subunit delta [Gammaproteobacteria bacterium]|nr:sarcosine oxidase subunit delta [Gammaproteobacteria bacterium]
MLRIYCPYCESVRDEDEFHCVGEAHIKRPERPDELSDQAWGEYLHFRTNPRGEHREIWQHAVGCRQHFNVLRDTESYEIKSVYRINEEPPNVTDPDT